MYTRVQEIDALKRNAVSLISIADHEVERLDSEEATRFLASLDDLLEAPNLRVHQIPLVGDLLEYAFTAGIRSR